MKPSQHQLTTAVIHQRAALLKSLRQIRYQVGQMDSGKHGDKAKTIAIIELAQAQCRLPGHNSRIN